MKKCYRCECIKSEQDFNKSKSRKDGLQSVCRDCSKILNNTGYKENPNRSKSVKDNRDKVKSHNKRLLNKYKSICGCKFCQEKEPVCLDFHHLDPSVKEDNLSRMLTNSSDKLKQEIRKCIVLCSNCHRKLHANILSL